MIEQPQEPIKCPFCGTLPLIVKPTILYWYWEILCVYGRCPAEVTVWGKTLDEAIAKWNTRAA